MGSPFQPYKDMNPLYNDWQDYVASINDDSPTGLDQALQTAGVGWVWMVSERAMLRGAVQGILISITFAFIVLLISTMNILIALYSIFSITAIVVSVVCMMELAGWQLGVAESIAVVILIGFSVDYVVHLANHYVESVFPDKFR